MATAGTGRSSAFRVTGGTKAAGVPFLSTWRSSFPLTQLVAQRPGMQWLQQQVDKVDETLDQFRERLGQLQAAPPSPSRCRTGWKACRPSPAKLATCAAGQHHGAGPWTGASLARLAVADAVGLRNLQRAHLVLRMLAGLGEAARQAVASQAQERGTPKQFKQAAERALKEPLAR